MGHDETVAILHAAYKPHRPVSVRTYEQPTGAEIVERRSDVHLLPLKQPWVGERQAAAHRKTGAPMAGTPAILRSIGTLALEVFLASAAPSV